MSDKLTYTDGKQEIIVDLDEKSGFNQAVMLILGGFHLKESSE